MELSHEDDTYTKIQITKYKLCNFIIQVADWLLVNKESEQ